MPAAAVPNSLNAVSCTSAYFCEAVGTATGSSGYTISLAERWNGTAWKVQATLVGVTTDPGSIGANLVEAGD
jgi:hypothetical protein